MTLPASGEPAAPLIEFRSVRKSYPSKKVLQGVDWTISPGTVVGLLGTNGSGKSTLIKCLLGLLRPDSGRIQINGHEVWNLPDQIKARLGYVDQQPRFYPWMRGSQLLKYVAAFYPRWNDALIARLAKEWDVPLDQAYGSLSPGQQHKLAIVLALGHEPDLLVLDEPVSALDPVARRNFLSTLLDYVGSRNCTVLFSTHITSDLERVATHVAILESGQIRWFDELDNLKDRIKRLRIRSRDPLPRDWVLPGVIQRHDHDANSSVLLAEYSPELAARLGQQAGIDVTVEDLNLEEIFLELHQKGSEHVSH